LGIAYSDKRKKEYEKALEYYKKVLEIDPNNNNKDVIKKNIEDINKILKSRQQQQ
jgi:tetratricopeptide (TPR) repeat protein